MHKNQVEDLQSAEVRLESLIQIILGLQLYVSNKNQLPMLDIDSYLQVPIEQLAEIKEILHKQIEMLVE